MTQTIRTMRIDADIAGFEAAMKSLDQTTAEFGRTFTRVIAQSVRSGKTFEDQLRTLVSRLSEIALRQGLKPLEGILDGALDGIAASNGFGSSSWGGRWQGHGIRASHLPGNIFAPGITFNVAAPDVNGFKQSEGQITSLLARAVLRGQRLL